MPMQSCVLIAHEVGYVREAIALALRQERPDLDVREIAPERLDDALRALEQDRHAVVVGTHPTALMQQQAHGWVVLVSEGPGAAFVGTDDAWRTIKRPGFTDVIGAILEQLDRSPAPTPWPGSDPADPPGAPEAPGG